MRLRIGLVAPYDELARLAEEVSRELGLSLDIRVGDLAQGVAVARDMARRGTEVIISRGGTALVIEESVDLPVIAIEVSGYDVLRGLHAASQLGSPVGVVGFKNVIYGAASIRSILGLDIREILLESENEAEGKIKEAVKAGIKVIVGDAVSVRTAKNLGIQGVLIRSGKEAILQAINLAERAAIIRRREHERTEQLRAILDYAYEGIISIDARGSIAVFNPSAEKILGIKATKALGKPVDQVLPGLRFPLGGGGSELNEVISLGKSLVVANSIPISINGENVGAVITFQDVTGIQKLEAKVRKTLYLKGHVARYTLDDLVGESPPLGSLLEEARYFASTDSTILITGETGTGKEMLAQGIHNASKRRDGPFVAINCAALPESLLETEIFGYEEGAFTGARKGGKPGLFELAHGGSVFLDEIGEMSLNLQARLLRVLERKEVMRVGGDRVIPVNVRVLAATHRDLVKAVKEGTFREDLFYRLNVLNLRIPPLRQRRQDIPLLIQHFLVLFQREQDIGPANLDESAIEALRQYDWPGNVRELRNVVERLALMNRGSRIGRKEVSRVLSQMAGIENIEEGNDGESSGMIPIRGTLEEIETRVIQNVLAACHGNRSDAARRLGISRSTLWRKLERQDPRPGR